MDTKRRKASGMDWKAGTDIYTRLTLCVKQTASENLLFSRKYSTHCADLNGHEHQKRGDICMHTADFLYCTVEANTTL